MATVAEIKEKLKNGVRWAVSEVEEEAYAAMMGSMDKFYGEYTPAVYKRISQVEGSLQASAVRQSGYNAEADVFAKSNGMHHPTGNWSEGKILHSVMAGYTHGGVESGTAVWKDGMSKITPNVKRWTKEALIRNGVPVK